ncbi:MAG: hypothetical protein Q9209_007108 [Squamulea sp. 1 TL-2023]
MYRCDYYQAKIILLSRSFTYIPTSTETDTEIVTLTTLISSVVEVTTTPSTSTSSPPSTYIITETTTIPYPTADSNPEDPNAAAIGDPAQLVAPPAAPQAVTIIVGGGGAPAPAATARTPEISTVYITRSPDSTARGGRGGGGGRAIRTMGPSSCTTHLRVCVEERVPTRTIYVGCIGGFVMRGR